MTSSKGGSSEIVHNFTRFTGVNIFAMFYVAELNLLLFAYFCILLSCRSLSFPADKLVELCLISFMNIEARIFCLFFRFFIWISLSIYLYYVWPPINSPVLVFPQVSADFFYNSKSRWIYLRILCLAEQKNNANCRLIDQAIALIIKFPMACICASLTSVGDSTSFVQ